MTAIADNLATELRLAFRFRLPFYAGLRRQRNVKHIRELIRAIRILRGYDRRVAELEAEVERLKSDRLAIAQVIGSVDADTGEWMGHAVDVGVAADLADRIANERDALREEVERLRSERDARPDISEESARRFVSVYYPVGCNPDELVAYVALHAHARKAVKP
jgi:uncharacterized small protein (DUF1192 family)